MTSSQHGLYVWGYTRATMADTNRRETADEKSEEGGDDVKSAWPLRPGLHTCYNG